jgi:hypothetical protein
MHSGRHVLHSAAINHTTHSTLIESPLRSVCYCLLTKWRPSSPLSFSLSSHQIPFHALPVPMGPANSLNTCLSRTDSPPNRQHGSTHLPDCSRSIHRDRLVCGHKSVLFVAVLLLPNCRNVQHAQSPCFVVQELSRSITVSLGRVLYLSQRLRTILLRSCTRKHHVRSHFCFLLPLLRRH